MSRPARRVTIDAGGRSLAALQTGSAGDPAVLLVPGYTGSKEDFGALLVPLAEAGYFATAIDLPGQFESPGPDTPDSYASEILGTVVRAACAALDGHVRLLGHSFGGLVSRAAVLAEPQIAASLVLLSSGPAALDGARRGTIDALRPLLAGAGLAGVYAALQAAATSDPAFVPPPAEVAEFLERRFLAGSVPMLQGMGDALLHEPDRVEQLATSGVPVLVVHGVDDDAWTPREQREMAARLRARYEVVAGAAHSAAVENPAALLSVLLTFWSGPVRSDPVWGNPA